jgi:two-component system glycerol uptake and utilization response regulator
MNAKSRILVIDGEITVAMMMVSLLTQAGYDVEAAVNPQKALQWVQKESFDLITLDTGLPDVNAFELFKRLKQIPHLRETPILFVSGHVTAESRRRAFEFGAVNLITKPFTASDFLSRISASIQPRTESRLTPAGNLLETQRE